MIPSIIILTYNSSRVIRNTISSALRLSDDISVVDSLSDDQTEEILKEFPVHVIEREFTNYGEQRNWAIKNLTLKYPWQLHLDADERIDDVLLAEIKNINIDSNPSVSGFIMRRQTMFLGRHLKHGGYSSTWHLRLFHGTAGHCEERLYDQHFYVDGDLKCLNGYLIDDQQDTIGEWIAKHNRWADLEVEEILRKKKTGRIEGSLFGNKIERVRLFRELYYCLPLFIRPILFFIYRYFVKCGFLDGRIGLVYCFLHTIIYRFLIDAKIYESKLTKKEDG